MYAKKDHFYSKCGVFCFYFDPFFDYVQSDWDHFKVKPILNVGKEDVSNVSV